MVLSKLRLKDSLVPVEALSSVDQILVVRFFVYPQVSNVIFQVVSFVVQLVTQFTDVFACQVQQSCPVNFVFMVSLVQLAQLSENVAGKDCVL